MLPLLFLLYLVAVGVSDITRDFFGDIFRMEDCHNGSRCDNGGTRPALQIPSRPCHCQCAPTHLAYREDKQQCVKDIKECYMSVFYRPFTVEAIPLVYLPTSGQLVHPDAHLSLAGRKTIDGGFPTCKASVSQYLTKDGWRTLTRVDGGGPVFGLFIDGNKTFLQFLGNSHDRRVLQQHLALVRLFCKIPQYSPFETCVAIRVGWVPGIDSVEDEEIPTTRANMMVIGLSIGVLGLVYVLAVLIYLKIRRQQIAKRKSNSDQEACIQSRDDDPDKVTSHNRIETSKRLELYHTNSLPGRKTGNDPWSQMSSIVETYNRTWTDRMGQHGCEFKAQDFQLQPEFFEPEYMASPPQQVLEYLERLQSSVTFARHRLRSCYRYQPTLNGIPEDDYFYQELDKISPIKEMRTTPDGGSASSMASLLESEDQETEEGKKNQKIPPKKPKRKSKPKTKVEINHEALRSSEQEQKEIQNAMNTLNETLDALEYDIYKHDLMHQMSDVEQTGASCPNSTEGELDDFDTSSCSSLSAVTVLGRDIKKHGSTGSRSIERNLSEEFSTFSNSIYSGGEKSLSAPSNNTVGDIASSSHSSGGSKKAKDDIESCVDSDQNSVTDPVPSASSVKTESIQLPNPCHEDQSTVEEIEPTTTKTDKKQLLKKSSSTESMTTISTDMTSDSLESRSSSPNRRRGSLSPTPSLVDLWLTKLIQNSVVPCSRSRRKSKKKLVLPESEGGGWEHVCKKHKDPCPMHDLKDSEPNLIDKLAHYSSKTMAGRDVAGYFQSLKQDVLKEHLKSWLISNSQTKTHKKGISVKYRSKESGHTKPLVPIGHDSNSSMCDHHNASWTTFNKHATGATVKEPKPSDHNSMDSTCELIDSLDSESSDSQKRTMGIIAPELTKII